MDESSRVAANKRIGRIILEEMWGKGCLEIADAYYAPGYIDHVSKGPELSEVQESAGIKRAVRMFRTAFPDLTYTVEDEIAEGDLVMARFVARGTHLGPFLGVAPTGRIIRYTGVDVNRIRDSKIVESWVHYDALGLLQQLGIVGAIHGV